MKSKQKLAIRFPIFWLKYMCMCVTIYVYVYKSFMQGTIYASLCLILGAYFLYYLLFET